jgi:hypothetical protein
LQLAPALEEIGRRIVQRLTLYGPFVAIHLRFEDDILAWSGCQYDDSRKEQQKFKGEAGRRNLWSFSPRGSKGILVLFFETVWIRSSGVLGRKMQKRERF